MVQSTFQTFEDFVAEGGDDTESSRVFVNRPRTAGPQGVAGPAGVGGIIGSKNVLAYGALGNGLDNDTAAFQAAQTAAILSGNNSIYVPPGSYKIINFVMAPGIRVHGAGPLASTLLAGQSDSSILKYIASATVNGFFIDGLGFSANGYTGVTGINLDGTDSAKRLSIVHLSDLYFNCTTALRLRYCANVWLDRLFANGCTTGFWLTAVADAHLYGCQAQNGSSYGFLIEGVDGAYDEGVKLTSCTTNGQAYGISVIGADWGQMANCSFTTCSGGCITLSNCDNWRITTTDVASAEGAAGIVLDATCNNNMISECFIALNTFGVSLLGTKNMVKGCNFEGNTNTDIYTAGSLSIISNNFCGSDVAFAIVEIAPGDFNNIHDNIHKGAIATAGVASQIHHNLPY